jgi:CRP/FNR family transcriptional regulator, anaerobic regulatory protein
VNIAHHVASLTSIPFLTPPTGGETVVLTEHQRVELLRIGLRVRLPARMTIYRAGSRAQWVFAVAEGVVKSYRDLRNGKRDIAAFLFPRDLIGLSEKGHYVNTVQAVTPVTLYRFPLEDLTALLKRDGEMQFVFLVKVTDALRRSQRRTILVNRRDAVGRVAMFLMFIMNNLGRGGTDAHRVPLPMTRSDIAGFAGLTLESVSRASAELERRGLVKFEGRQSARILDLPRLVRLATAV